MIPTSSTLQTLMDEPSRATWGFAMAQLPAANLNSPAWQAGVMASQLVLPDVLSYRISRTQDMASDTLELTFADDDAAKLSTNSSSTLGAVFKPGPIDKKILFYLGLRGTIYPGETGYSLDVRDSMLQFTGYVQTDASNQTFGKLDKTVTIPDVSSQFRMQVYDTFPHPLFGNQTLPFYDSMYDLHIPGTGYHRNDPMEAGLAQDGTVWVCDGKMFTADALVPVWGATHIDPQLYIGTNAHPTSVAYTGGWTLDYSNGVVTLPTAVAKTSKVSLAGNPTYMQPETIIRKLLVEKASWSPSFLNLQFSNTFIPMFDGQDRGVWDCLKSIAAMTCPRFVPWVIWVDENGVVCFYEQNLDQPSQRTYIAGKNIFSNQIENSSRQLRTVVRGDGTVSVPDFSSAQNGASSDQAITSIAYDTRAINEFGQTEPLLLTTDVTDGVRHLTPTEAVSHMNMVAQSVLYQTSRPTLTITGSVNPDYALQIGDKVTYVDKKIHMDRDFTVQGMQKSGDGKQHDMQLTLEEYYETINFNLGVPSAVSAQNANFTTSSPAQTVAGTTMAPPSGQLIGDVILGDRGGQRVYTSGDYVRTPNGDPTVATWDTSSETAMVFHYHISSAAKALGVVPAPNQPFNYNNLPAAGTGPLAVGGTWTLDADGHYYYGTPSHAGHNVGTCFDGTTADTYTYMVGADSVFYRYSNGPPKNDPANFGNPDYHMSGPMPNNPSGAQTDLPVSDPGKYQWTPPGNSPTPPPATQSNDQSYRVYVWQWWYLCLESNLMDPLSEWVNPADHTQGVVGGSDYLYQQPTAYNAEAERGKLGRIINRINPSQDGALALPSTVVISGVTVPCTQNWGGWVGNSWGGAPGPDYTITDSAKTYANLVVGVSSYTFNPSAPPAGFVGANVMGDGVNVGVIYGPSLTTSSLTSGGSPSYVNYQKRTKGHYCLFAAASTGQTQFLRLPFWLLV